MKKWIVAGWLAAGWLSGAPAADDLERGFAAPPSDTRPWCYWYWISDNLSKEGITRDLEAMARVGIGEALIGNIVDPDTPLGDIKLFSKEWYDCMVHAVTEARRTGVNVGVFNAPGWSQSGGPWNAPTQAMRYVASTEIRVRGPAKGEHILPPPKEPFQDIAVLAFPAPRDDAATARAPQVRCAPAAADAAALADGDVTTACAFPVGANTTGKSFSVDLEFARPFTARSLALYPGRGSFSVKCELLASDDGRVFRPVRDFVMDRRGLSRPAYAINVGFLPRGPAVVAFAAVTARVFRLKTTLLAVEGAPAAAGSAATVAETPGLAEVALSGAARVDRITEKMLGKMHPTPLPDWDSYLWPPSVEPEAPELKIDAKKIVNLTDRMDAQGVLRWDVPAGEWVIQRIGMTPTGAENHPTTDQGRGLEVDKMNRPAIEAHFNGFVKPFLDRIPEDARAALTRVVIDSYEVGSQNWTDGFHTTFQKVGGYDPRPWLPVLSGRIVGSADLSDRFLWDVRRHIADRVGTEYVGGLRDISNRYGLRLWLENYGHWGFPGEFLQYGGQSDDVGGEFWIRDVPPTAQGGIELRAASSAAHLYGKRRVYAEAFTSARSFLEAPGNIKTLGDWAFCQGINHLVLHVYILQPWQDRKPGVNAWFGTEFNRHNTWFEPSKAWIDYLRRCHFMLQRGTSVADVAYFIGEDTPKMTGIREPAPPAGYDYDYINAEGLLRRAVVKNGRISIPDGPSYALLVLPPMDTMRPETLRRIRDMVHAGACVLGPPPSRSPSMHNYPECDREVVRLAKEIWGDGAPHNDSAASPRAFGKGRVFRGADLAGALRAVGAEPAVVAPADIIWTHRKDGETDIFFVSNQKNEPVLADISFRVRDRAPELWYPDRGTRENTAWFETTGDRTRVPMALDAGGSVLVVFRRPVVGPSIAHVRKDGHPPAASGAPSPVRVERLDHGGLRITASASGRYTFIRTDGNESSVNVSLPDALALGGVWRAHFPEKAGGGHVVELPRLISWPEHNDDAVKHFSGTAVYTTAFDIPAEALPSGRRVTLDLGAVEVIAEVRVNGRDLGVLWKRPYTIDLTDVAHAGPNELEVRVTNLWWNRLVGDAPLPVEARTTFTTAKPRAPRNRLLPSGLLGPVTIRFADRVDLGVGGVPAAP